MKSYMKDHKSRYGNNSNTTRVVYRALFLAGGIYAIGFGALFTDASVPAGILSIISGISMSVYAVIYYRRVNTNK